MAGQLPRSATLAIRGIQVGHEAKVLDKNRDYRTAYLYYCSATNILLTSLEDPNWPDKDLMQTVVSSLKEYMERAKFISDNYLDPSDTGKKIDYKQLARKPLPKPPPKTQNPPKKEHTLLTTNMPQNPKSLPGRSQGTTAAPQPPLQQQQKTQPRRPTLPITPQNTQPNTTPSIIIKKSNPPPLTVSAPQQRNYSTRSEITVRRPAPPPPSPPPPSPSFSSASSPSSTVRAPPPAVTTPTTISSSTTRSSSFSSSSSSSSTSSQPFLQRNYRSQTESTPKQTRPFPPQPNPTTKSQVQRKTSVSVSPPPPPPPRETYKSPQRPAPPPPPPKGSTRERVLSPSPPPLPPKTFIKAQVSSPPLKYSPQLSSQRQLSPSTPPSKQQQPSLLPLPKPKQPPPPPSTTRERHVPPRRPSPSPPPLPPEQFGKNQMSLPSKPQTAPPRPPGFTSSIIIPGKKQAPPPLPPPTPVQKAQKGGSWTRGEVKSPGQERRQTTTSRDPTVKVQARGTQNNLIQNNAARSIRRNEIRKSRRISILVPKTSTQNTFTQNNQNTTNNTTTNSNITNNSTSNTTYSVRRSEFRKSRRLSVLVPKNSTQNVQVKATQNTSTQNNPMKSAHQARTREARKSRRVSVSINHPKSDNNIPQKPVSIIRNIFPRNNATPGTGAGNTNSSSATPVTDRWKHGQRQNEPQNEQKRHVHRRSKEEYPGPRPEPRKLRKSRMYPFTGQENGIDNRRKSIVVHQQQERDERPLPPRPKPLISSKPSFLGASKTTKNMGGENNWKRGTISQNKRTGNDPHKKGEKPNLPLRQPPPSSETIAKLIVQSVSKSIKESLGKTVTVKSLWNKGDEEGATEVTEEVAKHTITIGDEVFELIDHSPATFHMLRETLALKDELYLRSFTQDKLDGLRATGKSGSFFYQTKDRKFIVKSINEEEHECLIDITQDYFVHVSSVSASLLVKFFSHFTLKRTSGSGFNAYVVIMENIFPPDRTSVTECFDLKGSTYKRIASAEERKRTDSVLKDLDLSVGPRHNFVLSPSRHGLLIHAIEEDSLFLERHNIIDYSMLIGVRSKEIGPCRDKSWQFSPFKCDMGGFLSQGNNNPSSELLYLGIIDILQPYNVRKFLESKVKKIITVGGEISATDPEYYAKRFREFLNSVIIIHTKKQTI